MAYVTINSESGKRFLLVANFEMNFNFVLRNKNKYILRFLM